MARKGKGKKNKTLETNPPNEADPVTEEVAETITEEVDNNVSVTEMVADNENVAEKATKIKEAATRKGLLLFKVPKHLKFTNVIISHSNSLYDASGNMKNGSCNSVNV